MKSIIILFLLIFLSGCVNFISFNSVRKGDITEIGKAINRGANINQTDYNGDTPLTTALISLHDDNIVEVTHFLLKNGANTKVKNYYGEFPLSIIMKRTDLTPEIQSELIKLLASYKVNIDDENYWGATALFTSVSDNTKSSVTKTLIESGANVNYANKYGQTPLFYAAYQQNNFENIKLLIENGAEINRYDINRKNPLTYILNQRNNDEIISYFIEKNISLDLTPFSLAQSMKDNNKVMVKLFIEKDMNLEKQITIYTETDFCLRNITEKDNEFIKNISKNSMDSDYDKLAPIHIAILKKDIELINLLIDKNIDLNRQTYLTYTPLILSIYCGTNDITKLLIEKNVNLNKATKYFKTPLHYAKETENEEIINLLLEKGANPELTDILNKTYLNQNQNN